MSPWESRTRTEAGAGQRGGKRWEASRLSTSDTGKAICSSEGQGGYS